jgi:hypothetical protein
MNYQEANELFAKKQKGKEFPITQEDQLEKNTVPLEKNMTLEKVNKSFVVNLYSTPIITILPNGLFRLFANGKLTNLTKSRMEKYSPVKLKQVNGWWFVVDKKEKILSLYYERVLIDKNGKVILKISEKSIIFKRLVLILNKMIDHWKLSDYKISNIFVKSCSKNETNNLMQLLESSSKDLKSIYFYSSNYDVSLNMDQLVSDMLKFGGIENYNTYLNMKNNIFKSIEKLLIAYFIPYAINQMKFVLKQNIKEKEKINA